MRSKPGRDCLSASEKLSGEGGRIASPSAAREESSVGGAGGTDGPPPSRLTRPVLAAYASLTLPIAAVGLPISVYLPPFYAEDIGLGLATVGTVFMLARVWDVVTDPIMGFVVDRFPSRWGRRRHWIVMGVPILMICGYLAYMPVVEWASPAYLLSVLILLYVGYTFIMIAHQSWGVDLTSEYHERSRLYGWREIALILGMTTILALPAVIEMSGVTNSFAKVASMGAEHLEKEMVESLLRAELERDEAEGREKLELEREKLAAAGKQEWAEKMRLDDVKAKEYKTFGGLHHFTLVETKGNGDEKVIAKFASRGARECLDLRGAINAGIRNARGGSSFRSGGPAQGRYAPP